MVSKRLGRITWLLFLSHIWIAKGWDTDDLELFDLVEEVNRNFYEVLGVDQAASSSEIRKAYRKLSLQLHPDKNKDPDAEAQFRQLVGVYEVLKDEEKRKRYHLVLENGLPDWRQPIFYYRRARKMGMFELLGLLFSILTLGHYIVLWASYAERKFTVSENFTDRMKKMESKNRKIRGKLEDQIEEEMELALQLVPRPTLSKLWPVRLTLAIINLIRISPSLVRQLVEYIKHRQELKRIEEQESEEEEDTDDVVKKVKRKVKQEFPEYIPQTTDGPVVYTPIGYEDDEQNLQVVEKKGKWSQEEIANLAKAVSKFPGGTPGRWEKIAVMMERPVAGAKAKTLKGSYNITANASLQGGMLKQPKKSQTITDEMISQNEELPTVDGNGDIGDSQVRRRKNKPQKTDDKTVKDNSEKGGRVSEHTDSSSSKQKITSNGKINSLPNGTDVSSTLSKSGSAAKLTDDSDGWNKNLQTILEWALRQHPKGTDQRWDKIAQHIPGKSKEDCIVRFKYLADLVKKKKEQNTQEQ
ncbi:DNAJC1 [Mytilus edulis]|uniref:DNAJC1 n=1 Tax=Mytilus edulis TaxID=6550 RepID=A0A8S3Q895_MYTED|nr:DNAJC1 [Mytilus edulis]